MSKLGLLQFVLIIIGVASLIYGISLGQPVGYFKSSPSPSVLTQSYLFGFGGIALVLSSIGWAILTKDK